MLEGRGRGGTRPVFDHRHFPEHFARPDLRENAPAALSHHAGDFHQSLLQDIHAIAGVALPENFLPGRNPPFPGDPAQRAKFVGPQAAKQTNRLEGDHAATLGKIRPG